MDGEVHIAGALGYDGREVKNGIDKRTQGRGGIPFLHSVFGEWVFASGSCSSCSIAAHCMTCVVHRSCWKD